MNTLFYSLLLGVCWYGWCSQLSAKSVQPDHCHQQAFEQALVYLEAFSNDSAHHILSQLAEELSEAGELQTPFGLEVRLRQAETLEKANRDEAAIQQLLEIAEDGKQAAQWDVYINAQLSLARLHEKHKRPKSCRQSLRKAERTLIANGLDSLYPRLCIRLSSYHRIFAGKDSALVYAREVIRTAPALGQTENAANGHMLMGLLLDHGDYRKALQHFQAAAFTYRQKGNYCGYSYMMCNISRLYLKNDYPYQALEYSDSFYVAAIHARQRGQHDSGFLPYYYKGRGEIFEKLGQLDSALYYSRKGYDLNIKQLSEDNKEKVIEIEARFKDEEKAHKIEEQERLLAHGKAYRNRLLSLVFIILFSMVILLYLYTQLRVANKTTKRQSKTIYQTNEELARALEQQIMLQGEIHHRVKNNLQVIISLMDLQRDDIQDPKALSSLEAMSNRIYSMAAIHEILYRCKGTSCISLQNYVHTLCQHFRNFAVDDNKPLFQLELEEQCFNLDTLMPIGILLNELMTNSLKYAVMPGQRLVISMGLQACGDGYCLRYQDNGPGFRQGALVERKGGLGSYLLKSMVRQLDGRLQSHNEDGAVYQIFFREKNRPDTSEGLSAEKHSLVNPNALNASILVNK